MEWMGSWAVSCSLPTGLDVAHEIRQADEPNAPDLTWTLEAIRPNRRPITVGRCWKYQFIKGRPGETSDRTPRSCARQPDIRRRALSAALFNLLSPFN